MNRQSHPTVCAVGSEQGVAAIVVVLAMTVLLAAAALAIDLGMLMQERTRLQMTADAAALASVQELPTQSAAVAEAQAYSALNHPAAHVGSGDVTLGNWNPVSATFTPAGTPFNAVDVVAHRTSATGTAVPLILARVLGRNHADVRTSATAWNGGDAPLTRFLIDNEMIDKDVPAIEQLAQQMGVEPDELINDLDGDWFIDLPPGVQLDLPTGQVGDEGLFDIGFPQYPYAQGGSPYSHEDFLNFNEDGTWRNGTLGPNWDDDLDPLLGVKQVDDPTLYPSFVTSKCQVSPIYESDISRLNPIQPGNIWNVNAKGKRRGLLSFRIDAIGADPDGSGSQLPNIIITVCDPTTTPIASVSPTATARIQLVR